jgi:ABC-2 type transport system ATP-binding protein
LRCWAPTAPARSTLINIVCGIVTPSTGTVTADGHDIQKDYRQARFKIGLVPQELATDAFETVGPPCACRAGCSGARILTLIEKVLRSLSLWEKRNGQDHDPVGRHEAPGDDRQGARARAHILFLDEPTAGVDVELRRDMWNLVRELRDQGVTIILTTHYIEEAEEMADRVGVISKGELILVEERVGTDEEAGQEGADPAAPGAAESAMPPELADWRLSSKATGTFSNTPTTARPSARAFRPCCASMTDIGVAFKDLNTHQSSLEDIFVSLVQRRG